MFHFNPHYFTLLRCGDIFMNRRIKMLPEEEPSTSSCSSWDQNENFKNARNNNWIKYTFTTWEHYTEKGIQKPMNKETSKIKQMCAKNVRLAISCACVKANNEWWCKFYNESVFNKNVNIHILNSVHVAGPLVLVSLSQGLTLQD